MRFIKSASNLEEFKDAPPLRLFLRFLGVLLLCWLNEMHMMFANNLFKLKYGYRKEIKFWKKKHGHRTVGHFLFEIDTGKNVMVFERHCAFWVICRWFKIFNQINDVNLGFIDLNMPVDTAMLKVRKERIKKMHKKLLKRKYK